jgi:hypothetical protein
MSIVAQGTPAAAKTQRGLAMARFFELRGRRVVEACNALWYSVPNRFLMPLPYQQFLDPSPDAIDRLLISTGALGVRFCSNVWQGLPSGYYAFTGRSYDVQTVHIKHRPRVRKGLESYRIREVEESELLRQGFVLNHETMERQGRSDPEFLDMRLWTRFVKAISRCPGIGAIGAFAGSRLAAVMITCREDGWLQILHQMSRREDLPNFPNHALTYSVTKMAAEDATLEGVCYGLVPLIEADGLHEYKLRFRYEVVPAACAFHLHPKANPWLNNALVWQGVRVARTLRPTEQRLEMMETVLRGARLTSAAMAVTRRALAE